MTPLRLELGGFTVFREKTSVDFDGLELFAIAGPTGSGKSTILDALTYGLYGQTARLGRTGLDVLISPGLTQMFVTLEFKTAQGTYRVTRTADRKPSGNVVRNTRIEQLGDGAKWTQLAESEKLKDADTKLETLIGLDYDGFTRSVLLPQGAFDEFLKGDTTKRRKLLVNLLGLDRVEQMQKEAGRRYRDAENTVKGITERLEQDYAGATPDKRRTLKDALETLKKQRLELSEKQTALADSLKELDEVKSLLDERTKLEKMLEGLKQKESEMTDTRSRLELAKRAQLIAPQIAQLEGLRAKVEGAQRDAKTLQETLAKKQAEVAEAQTSLKGAKERLDKRIPELETKLTSLAGVAPLMSQLKARGGSLDLTSQVRDGVSYSDEAWDALRQREMQLPNLKTAQKNLAEAERTQTNLNKEIDTLQSREKSQQAELAKTLEEGKEAKALWEDAKATYERTVLEDRAGALREHLHVGDACPVCEQTVQTLPSKNETNLADLKEASERAEKRRNDLLETYQKLKPEVDTLANRIKDKSEALKNVQEQTVQMTEQVRTLKASLSLAEDADVSQLESRISEDKISLLAALAAHIHAQTGGEDPAQAQKTLQGEKRQLETHLKTAEAAHQTAASALERLTTQNEERSKNLTEAKGELESLEKSLNSALSTAQFDTLIAAKSALMPEPQMDRLEAELKAFASQKESSERRDVELQAKLAGRTLDPEHYAELKTEQATVQKTLSEVQTDFGRTERDLQHVEEQLGKAKALRKQLTEQQNIYDTYRLLSLDLRGNEFQEYLLSQVQAKLASRASHIIREVTEGRYDLRLEDGDYQVRDAWTTGELRNAKTLSGGETFIASLALALALSDTIAGSHALGALFLDEGFGTLDPETLDGVAQVLENLTKEGRVVGVITHVRELTERLPARLTVRKGVEGSSLSWDL